MHRLHQALLDAVFEFAHVARPVVAQQRLLGIAAHLELAAAIFRTVTLDEFLGEQHHVLPALAQGRNRKRHHLDAEVQVFAETLLADRSLEIHMRRRYHAHVHRNFAVVAHARNVLLLQHAQKLHLHVHRKFANLIEENRATVGLFEKALAGIDCAGERAPRMPEQEGFYQVLGNGPAVHRNERAVGTRAMIMDKASEHFFTRSGLTADNHGQREQGKLFGKSDKFRHYLARIHDAVLAHDVLEHIERFLVAQAVVSGKSKLFAHFDEGIEESTVLFGERLFAGGALQIQVARFAVRSTERRNHDARKLVLNNGLRKIGTIVIELVPHDSAFFGLSLLHRRNGNTHLFRIRKMERVLARNIEHSRIRMKNALRHFEYFREKVLGQLLVEQRLHHVEHLFSRKHRFGFHFATTPFKFIRPLQRLHRHFQVRA